MKHWDKVEAALSNDKDDKLFVEGYPSIQEGFDGIVVQATTLNTLGLMRARKEQQGQRGPGWARLREGTNLPLTIPLDWRVGLST